MPGMFGIWGVQMVGRSTWGDSWAKGELVFDRTLASGHRAGYFSEKTCSLNPVGIPPTLASPSVGLIKANKWGSSRGSTEELDTRPHSMRLKRHQHVISQVDTVGASIVEGLTILGSEARHFKSHVENSSEVHWKGP